MPSSLPHPLWPRRTHGIVVAAALALLFGSCGGEPGPRSAVLITLDTTRADAIDPYSGRTNLTPSLSRLAQEGVTYTEARTVTPLTLPSHSSMLTGLYPPRHTVRDNNARLPDSAETLAERARAAGFQTAAFIASVALDESTGTNQGFDVYDQPKAPTFQTRRSYDERPGSEVTDSALAWLGRRKREQPFFLWVHYFDPHHPYDPPPEALAQAGGDKYLGEIASTDRSLARLLDALEREGLLDETFVAVVADHGEGLGDHGEPSHGAFVYDSVMRVPFLLRYPDGFRAGERTDEIVSVADLYPTLLEAMGLGEAGAVDGTSLYRRRADGERGVYFESYYGYLHYGWSPVVGWVDEQGKYIHGPAPELYDPKGDPAESTELTSDRARLASHFEELLADLASRPVLEPDSPDALDTDDPDRLLRLQNIGYAAGGPQPAQLPGILEPSDRPAPHSRAQELVLFHESQARAGKGDRQGAIDGFARLLQENPNNPAALYELGQLYQREARFEEAIEPLQRTIDLGNDWFGPHINLGVALAALERWEEAETHLLLALEKKADLVVAVDRLITVYEATEQPLEAARYKRLRYELQRN